MPIQINAFNEYDATGDASFQNFQPGQAYTLAVGSTETIALGKAEDLAGAVFSLTVVTSAGSIADGASAIAVLSSDATACGISGGNSADFVADNAGGASLALSAGNVSVGVTSAGNLAVRSDDGALTLLLVRLA